MDPETSPHVRGADAVHGGHDGRRVEVVQQGGDSPFEVADLAVIARARRASAPMSSARSGKDSSPSHSCAVSARRPATGRPARPVVGQVPPNAACQGRLSSSSPAAPVRSPADQGQAAALDQARAQLRGPAHRIRGPSPSAVRSPSGCSSGPVSLSHKRRAFDWLVLACGQWRMPQNFVYPHEGLRSGTGQQATYRHRRSITGHTMSPSRTGRSPFRLPQPAHTPWRAGAKPR